MMDNCCCRHYPGVSDGNFIFFAKSPDGAQTNLFMVILSSFVFVAAIRTAHYGRRTVILNLTENFGKRREELLHSVSKSLEVRRSVLLESVFFKSVLNLWSTVLQKLKVQI